MAKSALDVSDTLSALMGRDDLSSNLDGRWNGLSVGFVDFSVWKPLPVWVEDSQEFFADLVRTPLLTLRFSGHRSLVLLIMTA